MDEKKLVDLSAEEFRDAIADLRKTNQEQADYAKRAWIMSLISTIAVLIVAVFVLVYGAYLMPKVNRILDDAEESLTNIQTISEELVKADYEGIIGDVGGLVTTTEESLNTTMKKIDEINIKQLNQAIKDLSDVIQPLANFFNTFHF